jgi:hypothetical protein
MDSESYYIISAGIVISIRPSEHHANRWAIFKGNKLICDTSSSPEEAAYRAYNQDFSTDEGIRAFGSLWVPDDIRRWNRGLPNFSETQHDFEHPKSCPTRPWRRNHFDAS